MQEMIQTGLYELFKNHYVTNSLCLIISYGDNKFEKVKATTKFHVTTNLFYIISEYADKLFDEIVDKKRPIRRIAYSFNCLDQSKNEQYDLFTDTKKVEKEKRLTKSILLLQEKYGKNSLLKAHDLKQNATQIERNNSIGGHKSGES